MTGTRKYCTFHLDGMLFGLDVEVAQEIVPAQPITRVPLAPSAVRGLINLRGQIITAIDLRRRLSLADRTSLAPTNIVIRDERNLLSMLVDDIGDVVEVDDAAFEPAPETLADGARELIRGAYKLDRGLLLVLDSAKAIDIDD